MVDLDKIAGLLNQRLPGHGLPQALYNDADSFDFDMEAIFRAQWIMVGFEIELKRPGSWMAITDRPLAGADHARSLWRVARLPQHLPPSRLADLPPGKGDAPGWSAPTTAGPMTSRAASSTPRAWDDDFDPASMACPPSMSRASPARSSSAWPTRRRPIAEFSAPSSRCSRRTDWTRPSSPIENVLVEKGNWKLAMENARECYHCADRPSGTGPDLPDRGFGPFRLWRGPAARRSSTPAWPTSACRSAPYEGDWWQAIRFALNEGCRSMTMDGQTAVAKLMCRAGRRRHRLAALVDRTPRLRPRHRRSAVHVQRHARGPAGDADHRQMAGAQGCRSKASTTTSTTSPNSGTAPICRTGSWWRTTRPGVNSPGFRPAPIRRRRGADDALHRLVLPHRAKAIWQADRAIGEGRLSAPAEDEVAGLHPDTLAVGHGYDPADAMGAAKPPLYLTSTFVYPSAEARQGVPPDLLRRRDRRGRRPPTSTPASAIPT